MKNIWNRIPEDHQGKIIVLSLFLLVVWLVWSVWIETI